MKNIGIDEGVIQNILEIGCGEGRDSIYFAKQGYDATAIDSSKEDIKVLNNVSHNKGIKIKTIEYSGYPEPAFRLGVSQYSGWH